ncbi:hypothetical protein M2139_000944 [Enterococcus sp. PF1-24]|uniref:DUF624 domain-containing protein n=1 Tax=unclassified Enterococcus TaxID=2608891 RepID=UPI0024772C77|nr:MULTISPECIES: DUF624 domain-containing protein [unclassified Enterococcus]MDH6363959.1 hypothetical protein [Enterococcus sp. PFB1-1]MDH6401060.1 hypothetical protein [Enterococcus sp. PF1-24]
MFSKPTFENNIYMKIFRWAYIILMGNLSLLIVTFPFFLVVACLAIDARNIVWFLLALISFGPGIISLFAVINEFKANGDVEPVRFFFRAYRQFWKKGFFYWLIGILGIMIGVVDSLFFLNYSWGRWVLPFFIIIACLALIVSINSCYFQVRNPQSSSKKVIGLAFYYAVKKWYVSLLNMALLGAIYGLMILKPQFGFVITPTILFGIIYLNASKLHQITQ